MKEQLDFIFFFYGLGFILLAAVCFALARSRKHSLPWTWLALFGLIHGINEWLDMLALSLGDSHSFKALRICVMAASFVCLVEFGRLGTKNLTGKCPGRWVTLVLFAVGCLGWTHGWLGLNVCFRCCLGFVGGIWTAIAFFTNSKNIEKREERGLLIALGVIFASYAIASGFIVPKAPLLLASLINHDSFNQKFGFPVQLLRGLLAVASAICVWQMLQLHRTFIKRVYILAFTVSTLAMLAAGWFATENIGEATRQSFNRDLLSNCEISAASIGPELVRGVGSIKDIKSLRYKLLKARLMEMRKACPEFRYIYVMLVKDGRIVFLADSEFAMSKDCSLPGDIYFDAPAKLRALCLSGGPSITDEYEDRWGKWTSAFVPIMSTNTGKMIAILGMDRSQDDARSEVAQERVEPIIITLLALVSLIAFFVVYERQTESIEQISASEEALRSSRTFIDSCLNAIADPIFVKDESRCFVLVNDAFCAIFGLPRESLLGTNDNDYFPEEQVEVFRRMDEAVLDTGEENVNEEFLTDFVSKDVHTIITRKSRYIDPTGKRFIVGAIRDISQRKLNEDALRNSEARYRVLVDSIPDASIMLFDRDKRFLIVGGGELHKSGFDNSLVEGRTLSEAFPPDVSEMFAPLYDKALNGETTTFEHVYGDFHYYQQVFPIKDLAGNINSGMVVSNNITARKQAEQALKNEKDNLAAIFASSPVGMLLLDEGMDIVDANSVIADMVSRKPEDIIHQRGGGGLGCVHSFENEKGCGYADACATCPLRAGITQVLALGTSVRGAEIQTSLIIGGQEQHPWLRISAEPVQVNGRKHVIVAIDNITIRKQVEEALRNSESIHRSMTKHISDVIAIIDQNGIVTYKSPNLEKWFGWRPEDLVGKSAFETTYPDDIERVQGVFVSLLGKDNSTAVLEFRYMCKDGSYRMIELTAVNLVNDPVVKGVLVNYHDITLRKQEEEELRQANAEIDSVNKQLEIALLDSNKYAAYLEIAKGEIEGKAVELGHQANHDALTGLPNRHYFEQQLKKLTTDSSGRKSRSMAVLFIDLDNFKMVNDTMGHKAGDLLLVETADRLSSCLRESDTLARLGGDEFAVLLNDIESMDDPRMVAQRMLEQISVPFEITGSKLVIGASIGVSIYPDNATDVVGLLKAADAAMYKAKELGRNNCQFFSDEINKANLARVEMEQDLRLAIELDEIKVFYQPIVDVNTMRIAGAEALLRWKHPVKGMISPGLFIPVAEQTGLIVQMGKKVLETACRQCKSWHDMGYEDFEMSVNVSPIQLSNIGFVEDVDRALSQAGLPASSLKLEVTETALAKNDDDELDILGIIKALGVSICLDDFGVGYSSLSRLSNLPISHVKIDGYFIRNCDQDKNDRAMTESIIVMAHNLGMRVTAEWVEDQQQMAVISSLNCDFAQGYLVSPALASEAFEQFVQDWGAKLGSKDAA